METAINGLAWTLVIVFGEYGWYWLSLFGLFGMLIAGNHLHERRLGREEPEE